MDTMEALKTRRSIRKYQDKEVPEGLLKEVIEAGMYAPSAGDARPWHFIVLNQQESVQKVARAHPQTEILEKAPVILIICADERLEKFKGFWPQDCSAAAENILLAAHAKGLGAVWVGLFPVDGWMQNVRNALNIPQEITPFVLIPMGYPDEHVTTGDRFDEKKIHTNQW